MHYRPPGKLGYRPVTCYPPDRCLGRSGLGAQAGLPFLAGPCVWLLAALGEPDGC
jgi:hypothetical protein